MRDAIPTSPEWDLPLVVVVAEFSAPTEHVAAPEPYLLPYANGPPLLRV